MVIKHEIMKKVLYMMTLALAILTGCAKELTLAEKICGEWRGSGLSADAGIYIRFSAGGTFELYQKMSGDSFELRRGKWSLDGDVLTGIYNDGEAWPRAYKVSVAGKHLTMEALEENGETNVYLKVTIPKIIKENCTVVVKSY